MTSEERARELLAAEYRREGSTLAIEEGDRVTNLALRAIVRAIEEEREANAKVVESWHESLLCIFGGDQSERLAAAIRQRGEA